jgi:hypothetical protein
MSTLIVSRAAEVVSFTVAKPVARGRLQFWYKQTLGTD